MMSFLVLVSLLIINNVKGYDLTSAEKDQIVNDHNTKRGSVQSGSLSGQPRATNINRVTWDSSLESVAKTYASKCIWQHNANRGDDVGENLATGTDGSYSFAQLQQLWYDEHQYYDYSTNNFKSGSPSDAQIGHYKQQVWAGTTAVGCGYAICKTLTDPEKGKTYTNQRFLVCNYRGSVITGKPIYRTSGCCNIGYKRSSNGLCVRNFGFSIDKVDNSINVYCSGACQRDYTGTYKKTATKKYVLSKNGNTYTIQWNTPWPNCWSIEKRAGGRISRQGTCPGATNPPIFGTTFSALGIKVRDLDTCRLSAHSYINNNDNNNNNDDILFDIQITYKDVLVSLPIIFIGWCLFLCCFCLYYKITNNNKNNNNKYKSVNVSSTDCDSSSSIL